jgi:hypothetical protein
MPRVKTMRISLTEKRFRREPDRASTLRFSVIERLGPDAQERREQEPEFLQAQAEGRA